MNAKVHKEASSAWFSYTKEKELEDYIPKMFLSIAPNQTTGNLHSGSFTAG